MAAGTDAVRGVRRAVLLALMLACAGCGQAGSSPTQLANPMTAGGGHDGGGNGGGGASGM